jgi:dTDP-4-amino-4,6-dideoxygalactose transaminase
MSRLAIDGGEPVRSQKAPPWPFYAEDEIAAVTEVLQSGKVNQWTGSRVFEFEKRYAEYLGLPHAIALANGSLAIELILRAYGIGPGDEVIVTPRSFMASASSVDLVGATPVFADVDPVTQNISAATIEPCITPRTKAIIPVHLAGWPCDMEAMMRLADLHDILVIEDCAQAHGAAIKGQPVGRFGQAAAFSFCQDKIITTGGEGGLAAFKDEDVWRRAWAFKDHGKDFETVFAKDHPPGYRWLHQSIGTNWRLTEMQAAIGLRQLEKLPDWQYARSRNAQAIIDGLAGVRGLEIHVPNNEMTHAWYRLSTTVKPKDLKQGWCRDRVLQAINKEGVPCFVGASPGIYKEGAYADRGVTPDCPVSEDLGERSLVFLVHPTADQAFLDDTIAAVRKVMSEAAI